MILLDVFLGMDPYPPVVPPPSGKGHELRNDFLEMILTLPGKYLPPGKVLCSV